jgi:hypothetical protein
MDNSVIVEWKERTSDSRGERLRSEIVESPFRFLGA